MRPMINIRFSELKDTMARMKSLVQRTLGVNEINSRTSFNDDLGVIGLDWDSFVEEYQKEFGVTLEGLDYSKYFEEEVLSVSDVLLLPYRLIRVLILSLADRRDLIRQKPPLTIGDLVLSVHAKRFVRRSDIEIRLS